MRTVLSSRLLLVLATAAAAAAAAVAINVILLGSASAGSDPAGTLSPKAQLPPAPSWTVRPTTGESHERDGADD